VSDPFICTAVLTPVAHSKKAAGAISFYIEHFVTGRVTKFAYGALYEVIYRSSFPDHAKRKDMTYLDASGDRLLPDSFRVLLPRVRPPPSFHRTPLPISLLYRVPGFKRTGKSDSTCVM